jgi:hypothetical protein
LYKSNLISCNLIMTAYQSILDTLRVCRYIIELYWPKQGNFPIPPEIQAAFEEIKKIVMAPLKPLKEIEYLLRIDAMRISPEYFKDVPTTELQLFRQKIIESTKKPKPSKAVLVIDFILRSILPTWQLSHDLLLFK